MSERELFVAALQISDPQERSTWLDRACGEDAVLRQRIDVLLQALDRADSLLDKPVVGPQVILEETGPRETAANASSAAEVDQEPLREGRGAEQAGLVLAGRYKLVERIGEGGMGTVWMAQQTEPVKRAVAVKLIKLGMDSRQVLARFEAERQALALMDHPNIARVLDAGTTEIGRPFFVMELVKGVALTKYCDEHRLTPRQRLELFVSVCQAVQHAHQKGIIHRDIKPSNILVAQYDGRPVPKVIDFGIAKAAGQQLTDKTLMTGFGAVVGTLEYMSPEQGESNQLDIDTRSDIYSLGVVLYELLTGSTPLDRKRLKQAALAELLRILREEEPQKPSTRLSSSADSLPSISAQRQMEPAKLTKLVRGELDWLVMKALEKDRNRRYETANGLARDVQRYLNDEPVLACPPSQLYRLRKFARRNKAGLAIAGLTLLFIALVGGGGGWMIRDRAARQREAEDKTIEALTAAERRLPEGHAWDPELVSAAQRVEAQLESGLLGPAAHRRAEQLLRDVRMLAALDEIRLRQAESQGGNKFDEPGTAARYRAAFSAYGLDIATGVPSEVAARVRDSLIREALLAGLDAWMSCLSAQGPDRPRLQAVADAADNSAWRRDFRQAVLDADTKKLQALAVQPEAREQPVAVLAWLGSVLDEARLLNEAGAILHKAQQHYPEDFWINYALGVHIIFFSSFLHPSEEAVGYIRAAVAIRPGSAEARSLLGFALNLKGDTDGAVAAYRRAIALAPEYMIVRANLADALKRAGRIDEAIAESREALRFKPDSFQAHSALGKALAAKGQVDEGIAECREAVRINPNSPESRNILGRLLHDKGQLDEAIVEYREAIRLKKGYAPRVHHNLGEALYDKGQLDEAIREYRASIELDSKQAMTHNDLGSALAGKGQWDEAIREYRKAIELDPTFADAHNSLAWQLASCPDPKLHDLSRAIESAKKAVVLAPRNGDYWNTLGAAHYRAGNWKTAVEALRKSMDLRKGGDSSDWFFLAMAHWRLGEKEKARKWFDQAAQWMDKYAGQNEELLRFRAEAEQLLGVQKKK